MSFTAVELCIDNYWDTMGYIPRWWW